MKVDISYRFLRRSFPYRLVAVVSLLACHLAMTGEKTDSLYSIYLNADKGKKIEMVNNLSHSLFEREITDTLYTCSPSTKSEELDAMMYYLMSEDYYDKELFEEALQKRKPKSSPISAKPINFAATSWACSATPSTAAVTMTKR